MFDDPFFGDDPQEVLLSDPTLGQPEYQDPYLQEVQTNEPNTSNKQQKRKNLNDKARPIENDEVVVELAEPEALVEVAEPEALAEVVEPAVLAEVVEPEMLVEELGDQLSRLTGLNWVHKTVKTSALGFEHYRAPIDNMTSQQIQQMIGMLEQYGFDGVHAANTNKGKFLMFDPANYTLDAILGQYHTRKIKGTNIPVYVFDDDCMPRDNMIPSTGINRWSADNLAQKIESAGTHYVATLGKHGTGNQDDYIVIAIRKSDAKLLGAEYQYGDLILKKDNAKTTENLKKVVGKPLTDIHENPVVIESMDDIGAVHGRPVLLASVGDKKLPFYTSTGKAGKTDVPTGKWEFFGGFQIRDKEADKIWFRKGGLEDILDHYGSPELKKIADALDGQIGDIRDSVDVLRSAGRQYLGGQGDVAYMYDAPALDYDKVNRDMFDPENEGIFYMDLVTIKHYLRDLPPPQRSKADRYMDSAQGLKDNLAKRMKAMFNRFKPNDNENN